MLSLTEDNCFNYTLSEQSKKSLVFLKLTDSALQAIEEYIENQDSSKPTIQFENSCGLLSLPPNGETKQFSFHLSNTANSDSFKCVQQDEDGYFKSVGSMEMKMLIHANEDSYANTKNKMAAVLQKQNCVKKVNTAGSRSSWKANSQHKKPVASAPVASVAPVLKKPLPLKPILPKTNSNIINEPIRDRLIHILATKPYKKPELLLRLKREGMLNEDENRLFLELDQVAVLNKNAYQLADKMWSKVQDQWKYYSPEVAALVRRKKRSYMQSCNTPPLGNQRSSSSASVNLASGRSLDSYPFINKKISDFIQISNNDIKPGVLPKNKPPKLSGGSESGVKSLICPAESTKPEQHKNRKRKSKCHGKKSTNKSTSLENGMKISNQSSTVQFSDKLITNKKARNQDIHLPFVKSSSQVDQMHNFQSISALSSKLEPGREEDTNTVSSFITNPVLTNNNSSSKPSSSGCIVNSSRELLLKSNSLGCKRKALNQVLCSDFERKNQSCLQNNESPPLNNQPSSPPANVNLTSEGFPDYYSPIIKKMFDSIQLSNKDVIPRVLPKNKPPKRSRSSESETKNLIYPAESTKPKQRKNQIKKWKHRGKKTCNKSTSPEDELKSGNHSSAVQFSDKLLQSKKARSHDILLPFVETSIPKDQMCNFQSVPVSSSKLEQIREGTNIVSSFISNPLFRNNHSSSKLSSSGFSMNNSKELLLKSNDLECKRKAVHQVSSAFKAVDKTEDIVQTSLPITNSDSEQKKHYSGQIQSLFDSFRKFKQPCQSSSMFNVNSYLGQFHRK